MALQSNVQIYIGGSQIPAFTNLILDQEIDAHHTFELVCRRDVLEQHQNDLNDESNDYLGKIFVLTISSLDTINAYKELKFKGIVTEVTSTRGFLYQGGDFITITGKSCSILADDGPHFASFSDADLASILDSSFQPYDRSKLKSTVAPRFTHPLHYCVQNGESSFQFASRLAAQYGEWYYYDGESLVFGAPKQDAQIHLSYGQDLQEFSRRLKPESGNYSFFTNDYLSDQSHEVTTQDVSSGINGYNGLASEKSSEMYPQTTKVFVNTYNDAQIKQRLDALVKSQKKALEVQQVSITGTSDNPGVSLGKVVKIANGGENYELRITRIRHEASENGRYVNSFEGISTQQEAYPKTDILKYPTSNNQVAIVTDNVDPDGLSRIKVQFHWQKPLGQETPWLRLMTPHAGGEKGFHFIPEIGEEVLVGFEGGNAERPFVLGTLYNGSANPQSWKTDKNNVKAIRTRSGHTIEFNDTEGAEFITIIDKNQNLINIDTASNNITITALETMCFNAKNIEINASENISVGAGRNIGTSSGNSTTLMAKDISQIADNDLKVFSKNSVHSADEVKIHSNANNLTLFSGASVDLQSNDKVKLF
ncbi:type VI secretion system Vgr family protein [Sungkyunkwania multivorans]|uniref:Type VI secretion system Vgr family protein n=1 Tax=Sungkyunkwania multivorans TaxID=1173618 RepID=A0ABW3CSN6_9FLAO